MCNRRVFPCSLKIQMLLVMVLKKKKFLEYSCSGQRKAFKNFVNEVDFTIRAFCFFSWRKYPQRITQWTVLSVMKRMVRHVFSLDPGCVQAVGGALGYRLWSAAPVLSEKCWKWLTENRVCNSESQRKQTMYTKGMT